MKNFYEYGNPRLDGNNEIEDCYIRALVLATKKDYDYIESLFLKKQKEKDIEHINSWENIVLVLKDFGYDYVEIKHPSDTKNRKRISTFLKTHKEKYIIRSKGHLCYAENGKVIDTWDSSNNIILGYWKIK